MRKTGQRRLQRRRVCCSVFLPRPAGMTTRSSAGCRSIWGSRLEHPQAVWVLDGSDFPKQGVKSAGVARQYCRALGKIANCQAGVFLAHVGPRGRALVDKRLYLPEEWTGDGERCATAGVPANRREYQSKTELAMAMLECAQARGHLSAQWVAGDSAFGMSPMLREGLASAGMYYVLDVRPDMTVWPLEPTWTDPPYQGNGRPPQTQTAACGAADHVGAQYGAAAGCLARANHCGGQPGATHLPIQRPAGAGNAPTQARRNPLGHLSPEP